MNKVKTLLSVINILMLSLASSSCTRNIYMPVETSTIDSTRVEVEKSDQQIQSWVQESKQLVNIRDSIIIRDSVVTVVNEVGAVISRETFHKTDRNHSKGESVEKMEAKYDSIFKAQRDEINTLLNKMQQVPVPIEKKLSWWERTKLEAGGIAIGILTAVLIAGIIWFIRKLKMKTHTL